MFKSGSIEKELMSSMEKELVDIQFESQHGFGKLAKAVDHLNAAATIFDKAGMTSVASDITDVLESLLRKVSGDESDASDWKDHLHGGNADENTPDDFDQKTLERGRKVEMEHTNDPEVAKEIAMDHMIETPKNEGTPIESDYYVELAKLEKKLEQ